MVGNRNRERALDLRAISGEAVARHHRIRIVHMVMQRKKERRRERLTGVQTSKNKEMDHKFKTVQLQKGENSGKTMWGNKAWKLTDICAKGATRI